MCAAMMLGGLLGYVLIQFAIGVWVSRRITSESDYILAGRSLGPVLVVASVFATWFGAEAIVTTSGEIYKNGLAGAAVDPFAYALAVIISGAVFASILWRRGLTTFADLFRHRYSPVIETLVVLIMLPGSIFWAAAQIRAFGQVLSSASGMNLFTTISLAAIFVAVYSAVGGLMADAVTDFFQGSVLIIGLIVLAVAISLNYQDPAAVMAAIEPDKLNIFARMEDSPLQRMEQIAIAICGSLVAVELISRFLGARSAQVARWGTISGGVLYLAVGMIPLFLGLAASVLAAHDPAFAAAVTESEQVVPALAARFLPQWNYVIFAGAIISAVLSTVHSALHAPASQVSHNIVVRLIPDLSGKGRLRSVRLTVLALTVIAFVLAVTSERIKDLVETASSFGSAGVFIAACFGIFTGFGGAYAAGAAIILGEAVWAAGRFAFDWQAPYIAALLTSFVVYVAVAMVERRVPAQKSF
jgi:SSS family solute:Na+ symporter